MGQKIHPHAFRLGPMFTWSSRWYADNKRYSELLRHDLMLRKELFGRLKSAGLAQVEIERSINKVKVMLHVARPGVVIGRGGTGLEEVKKFIEKILRAAEKRKPEEAGKVKVEVVVEPVKEPSLSALLVATMICDQLIKRFPYKRACNQAMDRVMSAGAQGVRIKLAGRIAGAEISRRVIFKAGSIPLSSIRAEVDFAEVPALTKSGYIGVKVWISKKGLDYVGA